MSKLILIVDDEPALCEMAHVVLEAAGYQVLAVHLASDAIIEFGAHPEIALALVDVRLPGLSGADLMRTFHQMRPTVPTAFITGQVDEPNGRSPVLYKPFSGEVLVRLVRGLIGEPEDPPPAA